MRPGAHELPARRFLSGLYTLTSAGVSAAETGGLVKRAWRVGRFAVFALIGGAVISVLVAEGIGVSGVVRVDVSPPRRYVAVGGLCVMAWDMSGIGWRQLQWITSEEQNAAYVQYHYEQEQAHQVPTNGLPPRSVRFDPPDSLPSWSRLWHPERWPTDPHGARDGGESRVGGMAGEIGVGWPLQAFSMDWDAEGLRTVRGGKALPVDQRKRVLLWRPIPRGLGADSLFYAAALAGLVGGARLVVRVRRKRRRACLACGYDLRGLAAGTGCPECGRSGRASVPANQA
jgi:hypothetical protein